PLEARLYDGAGNPITPATETTLAAVQDAVGATNDSAVAAGAAGTVSAKLRRVTADLGSILERLISDLGASGDAAAAPGAAGSVNAKLRRITADLADVLARLNTDLPTRASEQTLVQVRDALSALAGTVDAGAQKVTLTGRVEVLAELENVDVPANSIVDIVPRGIRSGYTELRGGFYVNGAVRG